jgi:hypothetical protein
MFVLQPVVRPEEIPGKATGKVVEDVATVLAADDGPAGQLIVFTRGLEVSPI